MQSEENNWKEAIIHDQLGAKDREIAALFEQLHIKDEQIANYQTHTHELNCIVKGLSDQRVALQAAAPVTSSGRSMPWALSSIAALMLFMLAISYVKIRNEYIAVSNESIYLSERLELQRDSLAKKSAAINQQRNQMALLHSEIREGDDALAAVMLELKNLRSIEDEAPLDIASE